MHRKPLDDSQAPWEVEHEDVRLSNGARNEYDEIGHYSTCGGIARCRADDPGLIRPGNST